MSPISLLLRKLQLAFFRFAFKLLGKLALGVIRLLFKSVLREFSRRDHTPAQRSAPAGPPPFATGASRTGQPAPQQVLEGECRRLDQH
jgi:hypothetical protein